MAISTGSGVTGSRIDAEDGQMRLSRRRHSAKTLTGCAASIAINGPARARARMYASAASSMT